ncbi:MAG: uracil-DNA glycosylase, partial [Acidobacteria bacterium]
MPLDPPSRTALAERIKFYNELGIYDFYRRSETNTREEMPLQIIPVENAPAAPLQLIREDIGDCTRCRLHKQGRKQIVFGVGDPDADLMFIGEAPGADEDEQGEPFVGRAGQLLTNMIKAMGLRREDVYIANIIKCRPPANRTPERDECETCSPFLMRQ